MANLVVTIDGPAGSGKSTVARQLARRLGAAFLDTGAMYRAVTLAAMRAGIDLENEAAMLAVMRDSRFAFDAADGAMRVRLDGEDVSDAIRRPDVTANAKHAARAPKVRAALVEMQRAFAAEHEQIVTEGRDQGTVAFSDARYKFYLTAEAAERARRRYAELQASGETQSVDEIQRAIEQRDRSDEQRSVGPMKPAADAIVVDTTELTIEGMVERLLECMEKLC